MLQPFTKEWWADHAQMHSTVHSQHFKHACIKYAAIIMLLSSHPHVVRSLSAADASEISLVQLITADGVCCRLF